MVYLTKAEKDSIERTVQNEALNSFQGETFDMMDFILTKAMLRHQLTEKALAKTEKNGNGEDA